MSAKWHARISDEQRSDLPPKSGETMKQYAARWVAHVNRGGQLKFQRAWQERDQ